MDHADIEATSPLVIPCTQDDVSLANSVASDISASVLPSGSTRQPQWHLLVDAGVVSLIDPTGKSVTIDFASGRHAARLREAGRQKAPLARALGIKKSIHSEGKPLTVIDATGGLGQDSWAIAALGCEVTLIERQPLLQALLANAMQRARSDRSPTIRHTAERLTLLSGNARDWLDPDIHRQARSRSAEVVFLDPMYPEQRRRGASRKGMQMLHALVGADTGNEQLLAAAIRASTRRVVVKRPLKAPPIQGDATVGCQRTMITSPNTRYDVYHVNTPV